MASSMDDAVTSSDGDVKYRDWAIALGVTTAVFLVTTLLLACVLFVVVCRKIVRLRKEREARVTGVLEGVTSPHWIDHTSLGDMLSQDRDSPEKQPQKIWSISTQTFERNQIQASQQTSTNPAVATSVPAQTTCTVDNVNGTIVSSGSSGAREENFSGETDDGERTTSMAGSPTAAGGQQNIKPNRIAPPPPKTRKKTKEQNGVAATPNDAEYREPVPYVYPMHKLKQNLKQKQKQKDPTAPTGGNQSHEYAQPHAHIQVQQHDGVTIKQTSVTSNAKKHEYHSIDPKLKQPTGQYQDLLVNGLPRGQSLPTISTFTTLNS